MRCLKNFTALCLGAFVLLCGSTETVSAVTTRYVAPVALGSGTGASPADAADYRDSSFWNSVQSSLKSDPVTVRLLDGQYNKAGLKLHAMGHRTHRLTIQGDTANGAILNAPASIMMKLGGVQNTTIRNLHFTGPITEYAFHIEGRVPSTLSQDILVEGCTFIDLADLRYGAIGTAYGHVRNVTIRNCTFRRVGASTSAHMMYNAYGSNHIRLYNNHFEDCRGDYVRFRDDVDFSTLIGNTFVSTGRKYNKPFAAILVLNDVDPGDETFATNYLISNNQFIYQESGGQRYAITFYHRGYDPAGESHLMTAAEGAILSGGKTAQKKDLLLANTGINGDRIYVYDNTYQGVDRRVVFGSFAAYGATSKGWNGWADIGDILRSDPPPAHAPVLERKGDIQVK